MLVLMLKCIIHTFLLYSYLVLLLLLLLIVVLIVFQFHIIQSQRFVGFPVSIIHFNGHFRIIVRCIQVLEIGKAING